MRRLPVLTLFIAVLAMTVLVYWQGLGGPLLFDDYYNLEPIGQWLQGNRSWEWVVFTNRSGILGRSVSMASMVLNVAISGDGVWGLKFGNLVLHLVTGTLVYFLFAAFVRARGVVANAAERTMHWLPCAGAALWLVHPLFVSTVLYLIQRMAILSTLFMVLGMLAYLHGRMRIQSGKYRSAAVLLLLGVPACTVLASLSKENGILLPSLCAVLELVLFAPARGQRRHWLSRGVLAVGLVVPALAVIALTLAGAPQIVAGYSNRPFTLAERLMTESRVLWDYIASLLLPLGPRLGLYHDDFPISHGLLDPVTTLPAIVAWALVIALAWRARRAIPGFTLGLGIFMVGQAVESSVFPLLLYFEHRNYLPGIGILWALLSLATWLGMRFSSRLDKPVHVATGSLVALFVALSVATAARSGVWQSREALLAQGLAYHPQSRGLRMDLIVEATNRNPPDFAEVRDHIAALAASPQEDTRRLAATLSLLNDCMQGAPSTSSIVASAFSGRASVIQADHIKVIERLADYSTHGGCPGMPPRRMASELEQMLNKARLPADDFFMHKLRFINANLYVAAGDGTNALMQSRLAYGGKRGEEPIGLLLAQLEEQAGNPDAARRALFQTSRTLPVGDALGRKIIDDAMRKLDEDTRDAGNKGIN